MSKDVFIRLYVDAIHSGMIADMGAERWQTLCVLAAYMDEKGECHPSQDLIAHRLGVSRAAANRRIRNLRDYRWKGEPLIEVEKVRDQDRNVWANTRYKLRPISGFSIFKGSYVKSS